jgi:hypothetical protein
MERIKVAVSPFYGGENWTDELTGITFEKNARGLNVYSIPASLDLTNIRKAIRLNALILVEGNVGDFNEVEEVVIPEPVVEEPVEEVVQAPVVEEPTLDIEIGIKEEEASKKKSTKKKK